MTKMIREERVRRGWTLEYVGKRVGVTRAAIQRIETGERKPSYDVLCALEALFERPHQELFREVDPKCER